ncbi:DUF6114 domain-containing protein [Thermomonospora umbrina]|uniref:Uncharacterized protein n=1 Tax=Thermomonospora umbrina TaxID=111806 RepID=A0A3D9SMR3_9ACTN|nr:DUF6114 domain-containing protein [Thermomonospora umbrina]REE95223.1 hypothetical protein DFJ69_0606 [Thermomonospora umbrina]
MNASDRFRRWRATRPFWGGLLTVSAGAELLLVPLAPLSQQVQLGMPGLSGRTVALLLVTAGVTVWCQPAQHSFLGVVTVLLGIVSWITANLGGFGVGMALALLGGGLSFGWTTTARSSSSSSSSSSEPPR